MRERVLPTPYLLILGGMCLQLSRRYGLARVAVLFQFGRALLRNHNQRALSPGCGKPIFWQPYGGGVNSAVIATYFAAEYCI